MLRRSAIFRLLVAGQLCIAAPAVAQPTRSAEADAHFKSATQFFQARRFGEALEEYQTAYDTQPAFQLLYNIGQVHLALGHWVEALDAYERYLAEGASAVPPARRTAVETEIGNLHGKIGDVSVRTQPDGAELRLDGKIVGKSPLAKPIRIAAGRHLVEGALDGYRRASEGVEIRGGQPATVTLTLIKIPTDVAPVPPPVAPATTSPTPVATPSPASLPLPEASLRPSSPPTTTMAVHTNGSSQQAMGWILGSIGLAGVAIGTIVLVSAVSSRGDATNDARNALSMNDTAAYADATSRHDSAQTHMVTGGIIGGVGGAIMLTGIVLIATAPSSTVSATGLRLSPWSSAHAGGATLAGAW